MKIITIGVYGFTSKQFFETLEKAGVDVFCDIRWRRGVRGADYAFANHKRLQRQLESMGIKYIHRRDLAPTPEIRQRQYAEDKKMHVAKRKRSQLSPNFINAYHEEILNDFDVDAFIMELPEDTKVLALFCVEREPGACHRSLVAEKIQAATGASVEHLLPE